ncbi:hypothetical protein HRR76_006277 [Exophiala dermatitidis]|nr:hypothetical protein HRR76_006277 [Exophiala dermatitidis]KAJ4541428.1 hypothetical protein HRR77_006221 [Exophiala dermatitidis]KAJ4564028.1 hypothetical protein HRR79_006055 [Exophiala dermatitidis]KAJ4576498.1 hypothetical protein HRR82_005895 [Exophiala dermatitidis]KAJ4617867.1 hypothetical protein HRR85_002854 [Exophiala dermatitidis]
MNERGQEKPSERSTACATCGKTFARSDTLLRHEKSHQATEDRGPVHRVTHGTFRACRACATARSRCSGGVPCGRCNVRNIECTYPNKRRKGSSPVEYAKVEGEGSKQQLLGHFSQLVFSDNESNSYTSNSHDRRSPVSTILADTVPGPNPVPSSFIQPGFASYNANNMPSSHSEQQPLDSGAINPVSGQLLQPDNYATTTVNPHFQADFGGSAPSYDYTAFDEPLNWIPPSIYPSPYDAELEQDFSFILPPLSDTTNLGTDYGVAIPLDPDAGIFQVTSNAPPELPGNQAVPTSLMTMGSPASSTSDGLNGTKANSNSTIPSDLRRKKRKASFPLEAFSRPREYKSGYSFPDSCDLPDAFSTSGALEYCSQSSYDTISRLFRRLCGENALSHPFESTSFPSLQALNHSIGLYFDNFHLTHPIIHRASFGSQSHWLVVLATATIGSTFSKIPNALDMQDAFQEFLRRAVQQYADGAPDVTLDIPLAQARILNLIGMVQADREQLRSMAPRYHADLSRWCLESGVLQLPETGPELDAHGEATIDHVQSWQQWIRSESLRRIGYTAWLLDCCLGYMSNARPLCNMDDARTPLPCAESAWDAATPEACAEARQKLPKTPSLCAALETLYNTKTVDPTYSELSQTLLIHALYLRTWEVGTHIKQPLSEWVPTGKARGFLNTPSKDNFWLPLYPLYANWRNSACDCLDVLQWQASSVVAKASGIEHPVVLHLHLARIVLLTPFQEIQDLLFSLIGKVGNSSRASFYVHDGSYQPRNSAKLTQIRKITWRWLREDQHKARLAMVHAGSVFWYVRRYSATSFFEPVAVYLAALVLWTYGSYKSAALERDAAAANQRPEGGPSGPDAGAAIQPSRVERKEHPAKFIHKASTQPGNHSGPTTPQNPTLSRPGVGKQGPSAPLNPAVGDFDAPASSPPRSSDSDSDDATSSSDEQPEFIHLDRPCDDEMIQHFVRNGHNMSGHMSNVGDICKTPQKVLLEGAKLLRTRLACWGVSREYHNILTKLAELRKAG